MFAKAYITVSRFTLPVINSLRYYDGTVTCRLGSFIVINDKGWIMTVAHMFEAVKRGDIDIAEQKQLNTERQQITDDQVLNEVQKKKKIRELDKKRINPRWITNHSLWWGADDFIVENIHINMELDLAIGQIRNFNSSRIGDYPVFKNPSSFAHGKSLCKLGFPFHKADATFDAGKNAFILARNVLPVPRFPLEGIFTRSVDSGKTKDGRYDIKFIETSSPGLRGQSGGPVFDVDGNIWAIQSRTAHLPLGFEAKVVKNGKEVTELQFLNVGIGVHNESIFQFLDSFNIEYSVSE